MVHYDIENIEFSNDYGTIFCFLGFLLIILGIAIASWLDSHYNIVDHIFKKIWFGLVFGTGIMILVFWAVDLIFNS